MTREEAIKVIQKEYKCVDRDCDIERSCYKCDLMMPTKEPILEAYKMAIDALKFDIDQYCKEHFVVMVDEDVWDKAEKALEQEPILDKIKAEIREFSVIDESGTYRISTYLVDQIIDKYREVTE